MTLGSPDRMWPTIEWKKNTSGYSSNTKIAGRYPNTQIHDIPCCNIEVKGTKWELLLNYILVYPQESSNFSYISANQKVPVVYNPSENFKWHNSFQDHQGNISVKFLSNWSNGLCEKANGCRRWRTKFVDHTLNWPLGRMRWKLILFGSYLLWNYRCKDVCWPLIWIVRENFEDNKGVTKSCK